ncbi:NEL-type E3 ubiquitin ligase domain-containing protein [Pseudomonas sp. MDT1-17]
MFATSASADNTYKGRHYEFIKNTLSQPFKTAAVSRGKELAGTRLKIEPWYATVTADQHDQLKVANLAAWTSQNQVDKHLKDLQDVYSFAAPLLQKKLKEQYGIEHDVKTTFLHLYMPKDLPWYAVDILPGVTARTVSLLDAALHNFATNEEADADSDYITRPDARGNFDVLPIKPKMSIRQFQQLCRELDIGALYKEHLETYLLPTEPVSKALLEIRVTASQKDALRVAAQLALMTGDIQYDAYELVQALVKDTPELLLDGKAMGCGGLSMMGTDVSGVMLITPAKLDNQGIARIVVYIPHDPDHPLKEYPSPDAFMTELARQLRENIVSPSTRISYRQFFSQFVDHQERGHFFADLEERLFEVIHHTKNDPTDARPAWRKEPRTRPHLQFERLPAHKDYWENAYQQQLNKILNDARMIAVSTADTDTRQRWAWWDNFKKILSDIFNVALLVATPFVPGLGELMMAYTAYQLTTDVIEGVVDLAEGLGVEAAGHVISVVTDVIQLAAFGVGAAIGNVLRVKLSPLVEGMKPVTLTDGKQTLWHPDLEPYEQQNLRLPDDSKPDHHGLHSHTGQLLLPLEGKLYSVEKASTEPTSRTHRIQHPTRPNAYAPKVEHNGQGAWVHEAENPADWEGETLMRRLGHSVDRFSPVEREQIRISSGTEEDALRRIYVDNAPPPPVLADTIRRFSACEDAQTASANIRSGKPLDPMSVWFESMITALPGWPAERAMNVYEHADLTGSARKYGNASATAANTLNVSLTDVTSGQLPERIVKFLNETELESLLGSDVPGADRVQALRKQLADAVDARKGEISTYIYQAGERSNKAGVRLLKQSFPDMPLVLTEKVLAQAKAAERQRMADEHRLPLRIKTQARELNFEAVTARAYDGFYRDELLVPDTERLALNTLKFYTDSFGDLRIEVREGAHDGTLRCSAGPDDASTIRHLVRHADGKYDVFEGTGNRLHEADDFYTSILRALPEDKRAALGYLPSQGRLFKLWIMEKSQPPAERRRLLARPPIRPVADIETVNLVRGPALSKNPKTPQDRVRNLYPTLSEQQLQSFVEALRAKGDPDQAIDRLRDELKALRDMLEKWRQDQLPPMDSPDVQDSFYGLQDFNFNGGRLIHDRLLECFERKSEAFGERSTHPEGGYTLNLSSDVMGPNLGRWWAQLRLQPNVENYLDQVTVLNLDNARFSADANGLLSDFSNVRHLSARYSDLTGLPNGIGKMRLLETLRLTNNRIRLTPESAGQLRDLTRMETLRLDDNPLMQPLDVGRMPRLKVLSLRTTGIDTWPEHLFKDGIHAKRRPRGFSLDLRGSPITTVPDIVPGSDHAFIVARTRLDTLKLSDNDRIRFEHYRQSVGFAPQQVYAKVASDELIHWRSIPDDSLMSSSSTGVGTYREESWHDVASEPESADFFKVIRKQRTSEDYRNPRSRALLTRRVWQMIDAITLDSELREELFIQAAHPETCADAGSQLFNNMGIKVLVSKAHAEATSAQDLEKDLVKLARSAARLEKVGEIARVEIRAQLEKSRGDPDYEAPDDVEVHLAYETGLAKRLELPWQSEGMRYARRSRVEQKMIDAAYETVIEMEQGDGLVNAMIDSFENPFWEKHLKDTHPTEFDANDRLCESKQNLLEDLRIAQRDWLNAEDAKENASRKRTLEKLAGQLNIAEADVFTDEEKSRQLYERLLSELNYERNELARRLTREAMARAGI